MKLTESEQATIDAVQKFRNQVKAAQSLGISRGGMKKRMRKLREKGLLTETKSRTSQITRYVITSAQNNTPANQPFLDSLMHYCDHFDAKLKVVPVNYENITLTSKNGKEDKWWSASLVPYFTAEREILNDNLVLVADVSVNATNKHPLSGFETLTGKRSGIFGHGQIEMLSIPTPNAKLPKIMHTTGSITERQYSETKAGKIAEDNHCLGALVVELDGNHFWIRQLRADDTGSFYDLNLKFTPKGVEDSEPALGLVCGDIHWDFICPKVKKATFTSADSIKSILKPQKLILHDVLDFYSASHHHEKNPLLKFHKHHNQKNNVGAELTRLVEGMQEISDSDDEIVFVGSNHNEHLGQWLNRCNPNDDPENALIYHELRLEQLKRAQESSDFLDPLEWWFEKHLTDRKFVFIDHDSGMTVGKYDISNHGHIGANGSRGSAKQFTKFGGYYILGHSHTPGIYKNVIQVGTSSVLRLEYNEGPSSWLNSHAVIYPNGLASLIHIIDGRWRA